MATSPTLALHGRERRSRANGPGVRYAIWFQGCSLGCPGGFNPETHDGEAPERQTADELVSEIVASAGASDRSQGDADERPGPRAIEGITVSGGEPFEQPEGLLALVRGIRAESELSIIVFSGFTIEEIRQRPLGADILAHLDVLIDGRYQAPERLARHLRGSRNQEIHLLSDRYTLAEIEATPEAEIVIGPDGLVTISGVAPLRLPKK